MYNIPTTNHWRFPGVSRNDPTTWCLACLLRQHEDLIHLLWNCPAAKPIWNWIASILRNSTPGLTTNLSFDTTQALLGIPLRTTPGFSPRWWNILRANGCWEIWKARCSLVMDHSHINTIALRAKTWNCISAHLLNEWEVFRLNVLTRKLTQEEAEKNFNKLFGSDPEIFTFENKKFRVAKEPPRVP